MGRTAGRATDDTRRMILDTATALIAQRGSGVSIAEIAETAGVSKGGLLYHFPTKDDLLRAGAVALFDGFRSRVNDAAAQEPEGTPGRLHRAYIRVSFADARDEGLREMIAVAAQLMSVPAISELAEQDGLRWREELMADGLPARAVRVIVAATDGISSAPLWGVVLNADDGRMLEREMLDMTRG